MTALKEYERLEASGLWRASPDAQRRDVIVSVGDATLVISDLNDRALAHWSLAAVARANPGQSPAIYHPDGDPGETLELDASETDMIAAIERLRTAIERRRPRPGRLRLAGFLLSGLAVAAVVLFWLPDALTRHAVGVVPTAKRIQIGDQLARAMERVTGPPCGTTTTSDALAALGTRLFGPGSGITIAVVRDGVRTAQHLPGGRIVVNRSLVEDFEDPDVVAGYLLAERLRADLRDPIAELLEAEGLTASLRLLTTGSLPSDVLDRHSERLVTMAQTPVPEDLLLDRFDAARLRSSAYAYAMDVSGETVLSLIEADPYPAGTPEPVLSDGTWIRLQGICGG